MGTAGAGPKRSSPLQEILSWSGSRPEWQRDALRRILTKGSLDATDIDELERIAMGSLQCPAVKLAPLAAQPLTASHLPPVPGSAESVSLIELRDLRNVNRIRDGSHLPLGSGSGLVVIYGENGTGKSGYARVIKRACRARGASRPILPDVFAAPPGGAQAEATIVFKCAGGQGRCEWTDGQDPDPRLANVFVFDAECADHYVGRDDAAAFTPFGLDVLPKLSKACDELGLRLAARKTELELQIEVASAAWKYEPDTKVGALLQSLDAGTGEAGLDALARLESEEQSRIQALREALASDPLLRAKQTRAAKGRVEAFLGSLQSAMALLSDGAVREAERQLKHAVESAEAAAKFAAGAFDGSFLSGTGSDLWKRLWEAAREFAAREAFPSQGFPPTSAGSRCVLCQQDLGGAALERFARFDKFLKDRSQEISAEAERALAGLLGRYQALAPLSAAAAEIGADFPAFSPDRLAVLSAFASGVDEGAQRVREALGSRAWVAPAPLPASPEPDLSAAIAALGRGAAEQEAAADPDRRRALEAQLRELAAREWLSEVRADVLAQIGRYRALRELHGLEKDFNTAAITTKSSELAEVFVTEAYKERFQDEAQRLGLATLEVQLDATQGRKGTTRFGLRLVGAPDSGIAGVASEGEKRCAALAAFLAELALASHQSALVFDDPVSSLDHGHSERIADRLAREAAVRQVVVFTHDAMFLNVLLARSDGITRHVLTVEWAGGLPGGHVPDVPWRLRSPVGCLNALDRRRRDLERCWNPQPSSEDIEAMEHEYSRLRSVLERVIEAILLCDVVRRFGPQIVGGKALRGLVGIDEQEVNEIERLLQRCHPHVDSHAASGAATPTPMELKKDIADARSLIAMIDARKARVR